MSVPPPVTQKSEHDKASPDYKGHHPDWKYINCNNQKTRLSSSFCFKEPVLRQEYLLWIREKNKFNTSQIGRKKMLEYMSTEDPLSGMNYCTWSKEMCVNATVWVVTVNNKLLLTSTEASTDTCPKETKRVNPEIRSAKRRQNRHKKYFMLCPEKRKL